MSLGPFCSDYSVLGRWAKLAETLIQEPNAEVPLDPLRRMVVAAERHAIAASQRLDYLFEQSARMLFPGVGDPLSTKLDMSSHRWLARDREEAYSDWLAWILERQDDSSRILPCLGLMRTPVRMNYGLSTARSSRPLGGLTS